jgi:hypothetical protein
MSLLCIALEAHSPPDYLCTPTHDMALRRRVRYRPGSPTLHTSWTARDGEPGAVSALAQTVDGYLWLGTDIGLVRFDGVRFEAFQPISGLRLPVSRVTSLLALSDGSLWIVVPISS